MRLLLLRGSGQLVPPESEDQNNTLRLSKSQKLFHICLAQLSNGSLIENADIPDPGIVSVKVGL